MGFFRQEYWSRMPLPSPFDYTKQSKTIKSMLIFTSSWGLMLLRRCYLGIRDLALMGNYDKDLMSEMLNSFSRYCKDLLPLPGLGRKDQVKYRLLNLAPKTYLKLLHMKHADRR